MPIDKRRESKLIAVTYADVSDAGDADVGRRLRRVCQGAIDAAGAGHGERFGDGRVDGALADPAQAPLCISVLRESLAPLQLRVGVGIGAVEHVRDSAADGRDVYSVARRP